MRQRDALSQRIRVQFSRWRWSSTLLLAVSLTATCRDGVKPNLSEDEAIVPDKVKMQMGDSGRIEARRFSSSDHVSWATSDTAVLTIDSNAVWRAVGVGIVTVTASVGDTTYSRALRVGMGVLIGSGDIGRCPTVNGAEKTARLIDTIPGVVFTGGDNAYESGSADEWANCYEPTWGRFKARTRPSVGNHDWLTANGQPYFDYWGQRAGPPGLGYYSYNIGPWHVAVINTMLPHEKGSVQEQWLRDDLAAHPAQCTIAYWHFPRFSSAAEEHSDSGMQAIWEDLAVAGADIVISGHSHTYERFAPQSATGELDEQNGIREFVVGTGGASLLPFDTTAKNSVVRDNSTFGVLKLSLMRGAYVWQFIPVSGGQFSDSGSGVCH